jgi:hypothetical protein
LTDQLFVDAGAICSVNCSLALDYSGVDSAVAGDYAYSVICTNACGDIVAEGTLTICIPITGSAPIVIVCEDYTLQDLIDAVLDAGGGCDGGGCGLAIDSVMDNGDGTYTLVCENACGCVVMDGEIIVCPAPFAYAPPVQLCEHYNQGDLEAAVIDAGGFCESGNCYTTMEIISDNGDGTYLKICINQCGCTIDIGEITIVPCNHEAGVEIELESGWNLISFPCYVEPGMRDPALQFAEIMGNIEIVYAYDACADPIDRWATYIPGGPTSSLTEVRDGPGYWLLMNAADTLYMSGDPLPEPPAPPPEYSLCEGWNLIGFRSDVPVMASDYLTTVAGKFTAIYGYDGGSYFTVNLGDDLIPGMGYWIAMTTPGTIQY